MIKSGYGLGSGGSRTVASLAIPYRKCGHAWSPVGYCELRKPSQAVASERFRHFDAG